MEGRSSSGGPEGPRIPGHALGAVKGSGQYYDKLYPRDGVLLYDDRLVISEGLREKVLDVLHVAHQGKSSMLHRAAQTVFWPGYTLDIEKKGTDCGTCNRNVPSHAQVRTEQSDTPTMPFESISKDFFDLTGIHYLITVDRLSGWIDIMRAAAGTSKAS